MKVMIIESDDFCGFTERENFAEAILNNCRDRQVAHSVKYVSMSSAQLDISKKVGYAMFAGRKTKRL